MTLIKFNDFKKEEEDNKLKDLKKDFTKNSVDSQQFTKNTKLHYNDVTKKMDDLSIDEVDDKIEGLEESKIYESSIDYDILSKITKLPCYNKLKEDFRKSIDEFTSCVEGSSSQTGYDEGDNDHNLAFNSAIQEAIDEIVGW
jgi:hypothetical protein